ncbi:hypothetical protein CDAR_493631 [Caerostris darwini]|uniref:Uncharacterized protein n=1 Tax=Caerostris darwini TaxID=1538125 RepID=A0AAV4VSM3_9ARAC|nr:hypothetical protein CDAR_493631 [Caerostris darwini]
MRENLMGDLREKTFRKSEQGRHLQPPSAWIRVILRLLAVPSRHPSQPPRYWNCAICAHDTAFVGRPLLNGGSVLLRKITNKSLGFPEKN